MSSLGEQPTKKLRLNSGDSVIVPSNDTTEVVIDNTERVTSSVKIRERDVGITEYVDQSIPGFSGVIKQR
jgi:hypothetical protein